MSMHSSSCICPQKALSKCWIALGCAADHPQGSERLRLHQRGVHVRCIGTIWTAISYNACDLVAGHTVPTHAFLACAQMYGLCFAGHHY